MKNRKKMENKNKYKQKDVINKLYYEGYIDLDSHEALSNFHHRKYIIRKIFGEDFIK